MASLNVGTVDVYLIDSTGPEWRVLTLQRGQDTRCSGAWETVHGHIEHGESPAEAARREVAEETGLTIDRLYVIAVQPFFMQKSQMVEMAVVFACFVVAPGPVRLGGEHVRHEWLSVTAASERFIWPRERAALAEVVELLKSGHAGPAEDVLRVR